MKINFPVVGVDINKVLTAEEMRAVDDETAKMGINVWQLMEMAGFQTARLIRLIEGDLSKKKVLVFAGTGNNGADAMVAARYLKNQGAEIRLVRREKLNRYGKYHFDILKWLDVPHFITLDVFYQPDIVIDGIIGYSIKGSVRNPYVKWIKWINSSKVRVYSVDIPSGMDADDGSVHGVAVKADATLTLANPKKGLFTGDSGKYVGDLYLADIGIPSEVYDEVKKAKPKFTYDNPFADGSIVRINTC